MRIAIGADHRGAEVCRHLGQLLADLGHEVLQNNGPSDPVACDYPDHAHPVAAAVASGQADSGILVGGSGVGMSIVANKVNGVRAATVHNERDAEMSRRHNDANVLCLSAERTASLEAMEITETWLATDFEGGRHERRVDKIAAIEKRDLSVNSS